MVPVKVLEAEDTKESQAAIPRNSLNARVDASLPE
jgi:hypothetical protein